MHPKLIHPVEVTIDLLDKPAMLMDDQAREPIHGVRSQPTDTHVLPAQIHIDQFRSPSQEAGGTVTATIGYLLVRALDMDHILGRGVRIKRGDHITSYTGNMPDGEVVACDLYITRVDPAAHYPPYGATLYKAHFEDRDPVQ
jgi:hypothetical protein